MNYFEIFEIPVQLKVDKKDLPRKYFELCRKNHPDYHINHSSEKQSEVLELTALINKAFKTFQSDDATINYVLKLKGLLEEEEKYELPKEFLMEVLEINEQLMESDDSPEFFIKMKSAIDSLNSEIYEPVKEIVENYVDGVTTQRELLQVKEFYYKKKYLNRLSDQLNL